MEGVLDLVPCLRGEAAAAEPHRIQPHQARPIEVDQPAKHRFVRALEEHVAEMEVSVDTARVVKGPDRSAQPAGPEPLEDFRQFLGQL